MSIDGNDEGGRSLNVEFHKLLRERSPLPFLNLLLDTVKVHRARLLNLGRCDAASYRRNPEVEHLLIVEALERRDAAGARRLMHAHLDRVGASIARLATSHSE